MSDSVLTASKYYNDIQDGVLGNDKLQMDEIRTGFAKTSWANGPITDSAPAGQLFLLDIKQIQVL